ncbi:MAG: hypothetical protein ACRDWW_04875 [Acidimicrobiales bacterium]
MAVDLRPCPTYRETLYLNAPGAKGGVIRAYTLNCSTVRSLPPGASATFDMQIPVRAVSSRTTAKLVWTINPLDGASAGGPLSILAS